MDPVFYVIGLSVSLITGLIGFGVVSSVEEKGISAVRTATACSLLAAAVCAAIAITFVADAGISLVTVGPGVAGWVGASLLTAVTARGRVTKLLNEAPEISAAGLAHFDALDQDDDEVVSPVDLGAVLAQNAASGVERRLVQLMLDRCKEIGHEVGKYQQPAGRSTVTVTVAVISRRDFESYPNRVREKFRGWVKQ